MNEIIQRLMDKTGLPAHAGRSSPVGHDWVIGERGSVSIRSVTSTLGRRRRITTNRRPSPTVAPKTNKGGS